MKFHTHFLTGMFCCMQFFLSAKDIELKTKIEEVTVFQTGAQVTRKGSVPLSPGTYDLVLKEVSPLLRKESIQVKGTGDFVILSVNHQLKYETNPVPETEISPLEKRQKDLNDKIEELSTRLEVLNTEEQMISSLKAVPTQINAQVVETTLKARTAAHTALTEIKMQQLDLERQLRSSKEELNLVTQELTSKRLPRNTVNYEIVVKVKVSKETKGNFMISYIVNNARWYPCYNVRVNNVNEPLRIEYKANVSQQTGEDWSDVKMTLSTTDPSLTGQKPKLQKWTVNFGQSYSGQQPTATSNYQRYSGQAYTRLSGRITDRYGEPLAFATIQIPGSTVGASADVDGNYVLTLPPGSTQVQANYIGFKTVTLAINAEQINIVMEEDANNLEEVQVLSQGKVSNINSANYDGIAMKSISRMPGVTVSEVKGTRKDRKQKFNPTVSNAVPTPVLNVVDVDFEIKEHYDIPSDVKVYTISIKEIDAAAYYQYYCAPKLDKDVFLTAQLADWEQYNLLEGQANIYYEETYVGNSLLNTRYVTDTLDISLGRDRNIVVDRKKSKEFSKRQLFGSDMQMQRRWDIQVKNNKPADINLVVEDQFPVSGDSRIEVKQEESSGGKVDETTGIVSWNIKLDKAANKKLALAYSLKYPKGTYVGLD